MQSPSKQVAPWAWRQSTRRTRGVATGVAKLVIIDKMRYHIAGISVRILMMATLNADERGRVGERTGEGEVAVDPARAARRPIERHRAQLSNGNIWVLFAMASHTRNIVVVWPSILVEYLENGRYSNTGIRPSRL